MAGAVRNGPDQAWTMPPSCPAALLVRALLSYPAELCQGTPPAGKLFCLLGFTEKGPL